MTESLSGFGTYLTSGYNGSFTEAMNFAQHFNLVDPTETIIYGADGASIDYGASAEQLWKNYKAFGPIVRTLQLGLGIHVSLLFLTGYPPYETGEALTASAGEFHDASAILDLAGSDSGWQGAAAQSYDDRNTGQQGRIERMAALDNTLADLLQKQKTQVQEMSQFMGSLTTSFPMAFAAAFKLWSLPDGGNPFPFAAGSCRAFQCFFAAAVLAADNGLMGYQGDRSEQTGAAMQTVADGYTQIATEAQAALPMHS